MPGSAGPRVSTVAIATGSGGGVDMQPARAALALPITKLRRVRTDIGAPAPIEDRSVRMVRITENPQRLPRFRLGGQARGRLAALTFGDDWSRPPLPPA